MNKFRLNVKLFTLSILSILCLSSCNEDKILDVENQNVLNEGIILERLDQSTLAILVNGAYASLQTTGLYGRYAHWLHDHQSDEFQNFTDGNNIQPFIISNFRLLPESEPNTFYWEACYQGIARCNFIINSLPNSNLVPEEYNERLGEAHFLRGFYYFLINTRFEGAVLVDGSEEAKPFSPKSEVYEAIEADFSLAAELLPEAGQQESGRPSKSSAYGYLGKALIYQEKYDEAARAFELVTGHDLVENYEDNFDEDNEYNVESLFEIGFVSDKQNSQDVWGAPPGRGDNETTFRSAEYSAWGNSRPSSEMIEEYAKELNETDAEALRTATLNEPGGYDVVVDKRFKGAWWTSGQEFGKSGFIWGELPASLVENNNNFRRFGAASQGVTCSKKFSVYISNDEQVDSESGANIRTMRYADVLLLQAEAYINSSTPDFGRALELINMVRSRKGTNNAAGLYGDGTNPILDAKFPTGSRENMMEIIKHERMIELCAEGHRLLDLVRWGDDLQEIQQVKRSYQRNAYIMPIPQNEINSNPVLRNQL